MAQVEDDKPALLLAKYDKDEGEMMLLNEERVVPSQPADSEKNRSESNVWYLDNGASNHMTGYKSKFTELNEGIIGLVKIGDGLMLKIEGKGSIIFRCKKGEERIFHEVYYIPNLRSNIISLGKKSEERNRVVFKGEFLWVFNEQGKLITYKS